LEEVALAAFGKHRRRERHPEIATFDHFVDYFYDARNGRVCQDGAITQCASTKLHTTFKPGYHAAFSQQFGNGAFDFIMVFLFNTALEPVVYESGFNLGV